MSTEAILKWAEKQPGWQQDALRRAALSTELSGEDVTAVLANLKQATGLSHAGKLVSQPLSKEHLQADTGKAPLTFLCSIDQIKNANRLAPDQALPFALDGITLIYGHNGSGKSGYCRILKKFCRALVRDTIHPDVFATTEPKPAEARIRYQADGAKEVTETTWKDGENGPADVAHLSVFDSHNARLYVDERNRIDYLPYEIEVLTRFGLLLTQLQQTLSEEIAVVDVRIKIGLPTGYTPGSNVSTLVDRLVTKTPLDQLPTIAEINALGEWTEELEAQLAALVQAVGSDPKVLADRCRRVHGIVTTLIGELTAARDALSPKRANELQQAASQAQSAVAAAALAAADMFKGEPLSQVGSDPWQLMFQHAKEYSKLVYPDVEPPASADGDLCVLCQQPLAKDAAERLRRFESYVTGETRKQADTATATLNEKVAIVKAIQLRSEKETTSLLAEYASMNAVRKKHATDIAALVKAVCERREKLVEAAASGDFSNIPEIDDSVIEQLVVAKANLEAEAAAYDQAASSDEERQKRKQEVANLQDRKRLSENLEMIRARRNDLELRGKLQQCHSAAKTNAVSVQITALRKELVTDELNNRIQGEVKKLDLGHVPLTINEDSRKGESRFAVTLDAKLKVASRDVLSEGEQRALGLACFLADVNGQPVKHGIIVDDPVSSLDHVRIRRVAKRLVEEAATGRQVIVFTHNLLFFSEVISFAAEHVPNPVPVLTNVVRKSAELGFGIVEKDEEPWEGKPVTKRVALLRDRIKVLEGMVDKDSDNYRQGTESFYTDLRESWERFVEEVLLYKVVERYGTDIKTQSLKGVIVDDDDYKKVYWAMKRASERSGHDMPAGKNMPLPAIEDMKADVTELEEYRAHVRKRSNETAKTREALEKPPKAMTA